MTVDPHKMKLSDLRKLAFPEPQAEKPPVWEKAWNEFRQSCPDYRESPTNRNAIAANMNWNRIPTVEDFRNAHALASYQKQYEVPTSPEVETDPHKMNIHQLRRLVTGETVEDNAAWSMDMSELRGPALAEWKSSSNRTRAGSADGA